MRKKNIIKTAICLLLCGAVSVCTIFSSQNRVYTDAKTTAEEMKDIQSELSDIKKKQEELKAQYNKAKSETNAQLQVKMLLEEELETINYEIRVLNGVIASLDNDLAELQVELELTESEYETNLSSFRKRARTSYEAGEVSYLEIVLTASSVSDMLKKIEFVKNVAEYDRTLLRRLETQIESINTTRVEIETKQNEQQAALEEVEDAKTRQLAKIGEIDRAISSLQKNQSNIRNQQNKYEELEEELERKIALLASTTGQYTGDELIWPVPGYSRISSGFGWRTLYGKPNYHSAIDIPAPSGTPVVAAQSGKVIFAAWVTTGGGNHLTIDHGGGLITHYNHLSGFAVSAGTYVAQGQIIGYVGTTGNSTGNHLDFRIYCKGTYYNPALFVTYNNSAPKQSIHTIIG